LFALLWSSRTVLAVEVTIPLNIDYVTLDEALKHQVYNAAGARAALWTGADKCQFLYGTNPRFERKDGTLVLETNANLSLGMAVAGKCVTPITWSGIIEIETQPYIGSDFAIKLHVINLNLYNSAHEKSVLDRGFDLIKSNLIPRLEDFSYDLEAPLRQIEYLIQAAATPDTAERVRVALSTLRPMSAVVPDDSSLKLALQLNVPENATPMQSGSVAPLSPTEVAAWQAMLDNWDAFIVFAIKQLAGTVEDKQFRGQLFDLLLDSRYRLVEALAQPQASTGPDPIRLIFIDEWTLLHTIIQSAARRGMLGSRALEFLSFVTAGDALFAADQVAPALGMRISEDDLRRLAHMMAPQYAADPLVFSYETDPQLQNLFGVTEPLESPGLLEAPITGASPEASPIAAPATGVITPSPRASPSPSGSNLSPQPGASSPAIPDAAASPTALLSGWFWCFGPSDANASEDPLATQILGVGAALNRIVVDDGNASVYAQSIQRLLTLITQREIDDQGLEPRYRQTYLILVKSTAWQESCWRQFIRVNGQVHFLESNTQDVGLMQINKHVWRGFYSIPRLEWDIVYNAGAGAEILMRLMSSTVANTSNDSRDQAARIARSTYAAYNGGPHAYNRWRRPDEPAEGQEIDQSFWSKYQATSAGQLFNILSCATRWGKLSIAVEGPRAEPTALPQ